MTEPHALQASVPTVADAKRLTASTFVDLFQETSFFSKTVSTVFHVTVVFILLPTTSSDGSLMSHSVSEKSPYKRAELPRVIYRAWGECLRKFRCTIKHLIRVDNGGVDPAESLT